MEYKLKEIFGNQILSRINIRNLRKEVSESEILFNFESVSFISRSVADELVKLREENKNIKFCGVGEEVERMIRVVEKGKMESRRRTSSNKICMMIYCNTMEDLKKALERPNSTPEL